LVEPLAVGFHAVARGRVGPGDRVAVIGCGMIGMGCVIGAAARGAEVIAIDVSPAKIALARQFGAAHGVVAGPEATAGVLRLTGGDGADVAIEAVGLPATFTQAIDLACFAGRVVYVGYAKAPVTYQTQYFNVKELDIMGSRNAAMDDFSAVITYLEGIGDAAAGLITRVVPFDEAEGALPYWVAHRDTVLKLVVER
jgi:threonine dehydrogenase-like Zn-dependent dehydrogenase